MIADHWGGLVTLLSCFYGVFLLFLLTCSLYNSSLMLYIQITLLQSILSNQSNQSILS